jgi:protein ImuA
MRPHPEGGHFVEHFRSSDNPRCDSSAIYYLLKAGELSHGHKADAEVWHYYARAPIELSRCDDGHKVCHLRQRRPRAVITALRKNPNDSKQKSVAIDSSADENKIGTSMGTSPSIALAELRAWLERAHGGCRFQKKVLPFGVPVLDVALPGGGLALGCLHEVIEAGPAAEYAATSALFVAGILARLWGPVLWCLRGRDLFAPALSRAGLHPDRIIYCETCSDREVLSAMEEGLRHSTLAAVVGEVVRLPLTASRRLQLPAEQNGVAAFVIRRWHHVGQRDLANEPSSAVTRWRISPSALEPGHFVGLPRARWRLELIRARGGEPVTSTLEACDAQGRLAVPAALADRPLAAETARRAAAG